MNPWSHQKQREKALQRYYDRANPRPKKQESDMAFDPYEQQRQEEQMRRLQERYMQMQQLQPYYSYGIKEPPEPLEKSVSTECIVGLRVWKVVDDNGLPKLTSVVKSAVLWPYRKALERDPIMAEGIHAVRAGDRVIGLFQEYKADVAGEVYLWGKVIECDSGYLADCAYPKKFLVPSNFDPVKAMQLEDEYGVPCEFREEFKPVEAANKTATSIAMQQMYSQGLMQNYIQRLVWP